VARPCQSVRARSGSACSPRLFFTEAALARLRVLSRQQAIHAGFGKLLLPTVGRETDRLRDTAAVLDSLPAWFWTGRNEMKRASKCLPIQCWTRVAQPRPSVNYAK